MPVSNSWLLEMVALPQLLVVLLAIVQPLVQGLDNGLALTPPMVWMSWTRFYCEIDCIHHPMTCINERLYTDMADHMVSDGYLVAGYQSVHVDDCWMAGERDSNGRLQSDPKRFPHGMKWLAEYMHVRGLKFGIYEDYGTKTCGGYPGSLNHLKLDADTFAEWKVDYLKLDGCYVNVSMMDEGYPEMGHYLNATQRPIVYSCSWPAYLVGENIEPNYTRIAHYCNLWRNYDDISSSWHSIQSIIHYYDHKQDVLVPAAGPGHWNDPDMIVVGNPGITVDQSQAQMAIWSIWSAPLIMSNDLRFMPPPMKEILVNRKVIAINQDPLGIMGRLVANSTNVGVYVKPVTPVVNDYHSYAVAFLNRNLSSKANVSVPFGELGLINTAGYTVENLFTNQIYGLMKPADIFSCVINPTGVVMVKATVVTL